jgi:hypothetical protein
VPAVHVPGTGQFYFGVGHSRTVYTRYRYSCVYLFNHVQSCTHTALRTIVHTAVDLVPVSGYPIRNKTACAMAGMGMACACTGTQPHTHTAVLSVLDLYGIFSIDDLIKIQCKNSILQLYPDTTKFSTQ